MTNQPILATGFGLTRAERRVAKEIALTRAASSALAAREAAKITALAQVADMALVAVAEVCDYLLVAWNDFAIIAADAQHPPTRRLHMGFVAPDREAVDAFWSAGLEAGASSDGEPGERAQYTPGYYGAFLVDPDGNSIEAVVHDNIRRGGNIDHLWIGVSDLEAASRFYRTVARHTGLREGRSWDGGRQFRGAWATFSLVADGRPSTENLHLAFPAPDRRTVQDFHRAATGAGYRDNGAPGERAHYHPDYYAAFVLDPDGTNVESVVHERTAGA